MRIRYATRHLVRTAWFIWRGGWESLSESVRDNWRTVGALLLQFKLDLREPVHTGEPPPFHPNCRCVLWPSYDKGLGPDRHCPVCGDLMTNGICRMSKHE